MTFFICLCICIFVCLECGTSLLQSGGGDWGDGDGGGGDGLVVGILTVVVVGVEKVASVAVRWSLWCLWWTTGGGGRGGAVWGGASGNGGEGGVVKQAYRSLSLFLATLYCLCRKEKEWNNV